MQAFMIQLLRASLWGGAAALGALAAYCLLRRLHAPSRFLCWLWLAVGLRFVWLGGIPLTVTVRRDAPLAQAAGTVQTLARASEAPAVSPSAPALPAVSPSAGPTVWQVVFLVWLTGTAFLLLRAAWSYLRLRHSVAQACRMPDDCYGGVAAPFTLGILRPRIYLPDCLTGEVRASVHLHEATHIRRGDPLTKPLFYAVACLHWFNPLVWLAFRQFEQTMEYACDEAATRGKTASERRMYCESILQFALNGSRTPGSLAFGQGSVKQRILHLLEYRQLKSGALVCCALAVGICISACMLRPSVETENTVSVTVQKTRNENPTPTSAPQPTLMDMAGAFLCPADYTYISRFVGSVHRGDDLCAPYGTPVVAAQDGAVIAAGWHYSYGNYVILDHGALADGSEWQSLYAHMAGLSVSEGQSVAAGDQLGTVGSTGDSTGNHLHFELYRAGRLMQPRYFTQYREGEVGDLTLEMAMELESNALSGGQGEQAQGLSDLMAWQAEQLSAQIAELSEKIASGKLTAEALQEAEEHLEALTEEQEAAQTRAQELQDQAGAEHDAYLDSQVQQHSASVQSETVAFGAVLQRYKYISANYSAQGHNGTDFAAGLGTQVYAAADGVVAACGYNASGTGNYVTIAHGTDAEGRSCATLYGCLNDITVEEGQAVEKGQLIGHVGSTGASTGNHLHLELTIGGERCDPLDYIPH